MNKIEWKLNEHDWNETEIVLKSESGTSMTKNKSNWLNIRWNWLKMEQKRSELIIWTELKQKCVNMIEYGTKLKENSAKLFWIELKLT